MCPVVPFNPENEHLKYKCRLFNLHYTFSLYYNINFLKNFQNKTNTAVPNVVDVL